MDRHVLSGKTRRPPIAIRIRHGSFAGLPCACGTIRKLDQSGRCYPGRADRAVGIDDRSGRPRVGQRRVRSNRHRAHNRLGQQKCDLDSRIRPAFASEGKSIAEAAAEAAQKRFRPILMTSFAFILGVYPLVMAQGAGAASRRALGTAVFGGMIASTILAVFFVPVFFVLCQKVGEWWSPSKKGNRPD